MVLLSILNAGLIDSLKEIPKSNNAADNDALCKLLTSSEDCAKVAACMADPEDGSKCIGDPCFEKTGTGIDSCRTDCVKYNNDLISFCVTPTRKDSISSICSFEWGDSRFTEEALCFAFSACETVTSIPVSGKTVYICNVKPPKTDPCNKLTEEICPYIGKCMWVDNQCVNDPCWEKVYSGSDNCNNASSIKREIASSPVYLGYCKTPPHDMHSKCNAGTGSNFITKQLACSGYPKPECDKIVTINNYEGGTLYVCDTTEAEFTVPDRAIGLKSFAMAFSALLLLILML